MVEARKIRALSTKVLGLRRRHEYSQEDMLLRTETEQLWARCPAPIISRNASSERYVPDKEPEAIERWKLMLNALGKIEGH